LIDLIKKISLLNYVKICKGVTTFNIEAGAFYLVMNRLQTGTSRNGFRFSTVARLFFPKFPDRLRRANSFLFNRALSTDIKQPRREYDHTPPHSAEDKKAWR